MRYGEFIGDKSRSNKVRFFLWFLQGIFMFGMISPEAAAWGATHTDLISEFLVVTFAQTSDTAVLPHGLTIDSQVAPFSSSQSMRQIWRAHFEGSVKDFEALKESSQFSQVVRDLPVAASTITVNDPYFTLDSGDSLKEWWLAKIHVPEAWEFSKGSKDTVVAIIDTGVNAKHEDLSDGRVGSGYLNYSQVEGNTPGRCLIHIASNIQAGQNSDDNGHGTLVAGIIGAIPNNGKGISGMNWNIRLMPIKALDSNGAGVSSDVSAGIIWAVDNGADIINMSLGGTSLEGNSVLTNALSYAFDHNVLVVAAAGNDSALVGSDLDIDPVYPVCDDAGRNLVLGVAALDIKDRKAGFSNYGRACIDLSAPGVTMFNTDTDQKGILSTYYDPERPTNNTVYAFASGTSIATPMVSGVAALMHSLHPDLSAAALRDRLIGSTFSIDSFNTDNCRGQNCTGRLGSGRIDALKAVQTAPISSDVLVKDTSGRTYLIEAGLKRSVSRYVFTQRSYQATNVKEVAITEIENIPQGFALPPLDGTLVKSENTPTVYTVSSGVLSPLTYLAFRSNGFNFTTIATLPDSEISAYRLGPNLMPGNGALLRLKKSPAVYFFHEGKRRLISYFTFLNRGLKWPDVVEVEQGEFDRYLEDPGNSLEPPLDGTLVKKDGGSTVYLVQDGELHPISLAVFQQKGFQFSQVSSVPESELQNYVLGADL